MKKVIEFFIPSNLSKDTESQRKARLSVAVWLIIALFNLNYTFISYLIQYPGGVLSQLPLLLITISCLWGFKNEISPSFIYPFYFVCCSVSIAITVFFTGGFLSLLFAWLATTPMVALLVWNKKGAILSTSVVILIEVLFFYYYSKNYIFPNQLDPVFQKHFFLTTNIGLVLILFLIAMVFENAKDAALNKLHTALRELRIEKQRSDELLLNILPEQIADELKEKGQAQARQFDEVSVLFTDFVNFTQTSEKLTPQQLVGELNECFTAFDQIIESNGLEKIKTIGDAYMAVCGLPISDPEHARKTVKAAMEILEFIEDRRKNEKVFDIRIGIHSGSVVAGIVGIKKFAYDIWGDTVNTAARMEQTGEAGKLNISETTYLMVKEDFECIYRGEIDAKNKGKIKMYFVKGCILQANNSI
ncbi:MAG TPA: adenylate/guanylate cyclase domain-containing protein [Saprospiraceae bacterium]|jgi:class 3 adenylate cyclase|nr:hypothetical protein [Saprospiraceae bacterium]HRO07652.1 adenylate/guanylate cyclase domain-containing protein [Saprospiraceae bacterium]HRP40935.1 adenylate/guanylate cyclase domain-containing protein [Saprospiraceae bacterium]